MTVGVAVSTHRRPDVLSRALFHWAKAMPDVLVVNHDVHGRGVAATKNAGISALMDANCRHLFLADDDVWPVKPGWAEPYVTDPEPHLMHCWGQKRLIADDGHYTTWTHPRGVLLYVERRVIDAVGGMRTVCRWGGEHSEWSRRIHNAGFTKHRYADLTACRRGVWHCEDYKRATPSSVPQDDRKAYYQEHRAKYAQFTGSTDHVDYRA